LVGVTDPYADFASLQFDRPAAGVLRITLDAPGLNAVDERMHRDLADVWTAIDRDAETRGHPGCGQGVLGRRQLRAH
jgi:hypothetical protein